jgi:hypothetical protein
LDDVLEGVEASVDGKDGEAEREEEEDHDELLEEELVDRMALGNQRDLERWHCGTWNPIKNISDLNIFNAKNKVNILPTCCVALFQHFQMILSQLSPT